MRFVLQAPLCNLCREMYNETKAEGFLSVFAVALLAEGVDRNVGSARRCSPPFWSPSSRRAWIEIWRCWTRKTPPAVALLAEGVDRNTTGVIALAAARVALLAEGVDRNTRDQFSVSSSQASPSSRRAWIEIRSHSPAAQKALVALLAEGVDRNSGGTGSPSLPSGRPPRGGRG